MIDYKLFIPALLAMQFAAFGWRINREISVGDTGRRTWLPLPDVINIISMTAAVVTCVIMPLRSGQLTDLGRTTLALGYLLIALHPVNVAAHYRLFSKSGR